MRRVQVLFADLKQDARYAARLLWRNPLFALTAALVLSIGIGATTTIFTVANGLLLRGPAGTAQPDRLVDIYQTEEGRSLSDPVLWYKTYLEIRERATRLDGVYAYQLDLTPISLRGAEGAERVFGSLVTTNYFNVLGVPAAAGRVFMPYDSDEPGASPIVVLSHRFWTRRFNADPGIVGTTLTLNGQSFTVAGVAPEAFRGTSVVAPDLWIPTGMASTIRPGLEPRWLRVMVGGRLKPGIALKEAAAEIDALGHTLETMQRPREAITVEGAKKLGAAGLRLVNASPIPGNLRSVLAAFLALLIGLVSIVLIIACANIVGVLLARALARRREIAVRLAIGAARGRLIRQLLTETMLLFLLGGGFGLLLARLLTSMVMVLLPSFPQPVALSLPLDGRVFAFAMVVSLIAAVLSGLAPALHASKTDVLSALNAETQGPIDRNRLRSAFVVAQVAFSIMLVVAAGLLARALERVTTGDPGFDPHGVEAVSLDLSLAGYNKTKGPLFARALLDRVRALPGVQAASVADRVPDPGGFRGMLSANEGLVVPGLTPPNGQPFFMVSWNLIEPGYFATLRLPLVAGRDFTAADDAGAPPVFIVPRSTARRLWPGQDAVGKYLIWQKGRADMPSSGPPQISRIPIVGVVRDIKGRGPAHADTPALTIYAPLQQRYSPEITLLVRTADGRRAINEIRTLIASMDANVPILSAQSLDQQLLAPPVMQLQVAASVTGSIGVIGLLLAAIGLYGVTAYTVARRTREIGIRIALGAERGNVIGMVLRQGMTLVAIGSAIGLVLAAGAGQLLRAMLFGLPTLDPLTFGAAAILFAIIGLVACYLPARRATQIDAMEALRYE